MYEPPRYMTINTAIEQLLEVESLQGRGGKSEVLIFLKLYIQFLQVSLFFSFSPVDMCQNFLQLNLSMHDWTRFTC